MSTLLYKYRPWDEHTQSMLAQREVFYSSPRSFNDPFEFDSDLQFTGSPAEARTLAMEMCERSPQAAMDSTQSRRSRIERLVKRIFSADSMEWNRPDGDLAMYSRLGVYCLSETCESILMWSHYSEKHEGVCIGLSGMENHAQPIRYQSTVPPFDAAEWIRDRERNFEEITLTKANEWAYEREWRAFGKRGVQLLPDDVEIHSVILGLRMPKKQKAAVKKFVRENCNAVQVLDARKIHRQYAIQVLAPRGTYPAVGEVA